MKKILLFLLSILLLISCTPEPKRNLSVQSRTGKGVLALSGVQLSNKATLYLYTARQTFKYALPDDASKNPLDEIPAGRYTGAKLVFDNNTEYVCTTPFRIYDEEYNLPDWDYTTTLELVEDGKKLIPRGPATKASVPIRFTDLRSGIDEITYGYKNNQDDVFSATSVTTVTIKNIVPRKQYFLSELQEDNVSEVLNWEAITELPSRDAIKFIDFPVDFPVIEPFMFNDCPSLGWINFPDNLKTIGEYAFFDCPNIRGNSSSDKTLDLKNKTEIISIGDKAFALNENDRQPRDNRFQTLLLGTQLTAIGDSAFLGNAITSLTIPSNVQTIGSHAFFKCKDLTTIDLEGTPEKLTIGAYCFSSEFTRTDQYTLWWTSLTSVCEFPPNVTLGEGCFSAATSLTSYKFDSRTTIIPEAMFRYCAGRTKKGSTTITGLTNVLLGSYILTTGEARSKSRIEDMNTVNEEVLALTEISKLAFSDCFLIKQVCIPKTVNRIGSGAFINCRDLEYVHLTDGNSELKEIPSFAFHASGLKEIHFPMEANGETTIEIIGEHAFGNNKNLTNNNNDNGILEIPDGVKEVGEYAFMGCTSVQRARIPSSVKKVGIGIFFDCTNLKEIVIEYREATIQEHIKDWDPAWNAGEIKVVYNHVDKD